MSLEAMIFDQLKTLVGNRVYPSVAPTDAVAPYITYESSGGLPVNFVDGAQPSKENSRIQISVWDSTLLGARDIAQQAETALRAYLPLSTTVVSTKFTRYDELTKRHGTYQIFSCWADVQ